MMTDMKYGEELEVTEKNSSVFQRISNGITTGLETFFYRTGRLVGGYPWITILICFVIVALFGVGMIKFNEETDQLKLWVPSNADIQTHIAWVKSKFPSSRVFIVIFTHTNILKAAAIQSVYQFYKESLRLENGKKDTFTDLCYKSGPMCVTTGILSQWNNNEATILALTDTDVKNKINHGSNSISTFIGKITKDGSGDITAAEATIMTWLLQGDDNVKNDVMEWEEKAIALAQKGQSGISKMYVFSSRTFSDEAGSTILSDLPLLSGGYVLITIYVTVVLGRFNLVEQRAGLALSGILCIGLSILFSFGFASACGWSYGPLHSVLPFLLLGIGVDDVFVVVGALNNLSPEEQTLDIQEKSGRILKHAGVSITVTSLTDIVAFSIGATTVLPALQSFCVFASLGILALYLLQITFFLACVALDMKRAGLDRDACCCCYTHRDFQPSECSKKELLPKFFKDLYGPFIMKLPIKIVVMVVTAGLLGLNIWGMVNLKQEFDPAWFLPSDSYAQDYIQASEDYFPNNGEAGGVYCGNIDYFANKAKMNQLFSDLTSNQYIYSDSVDSWFKSFTGWLSASTDPTVQAQLDANKYPSDSNAFYSLLKDYTENHPAGQRYSRYISFGTNPSLHIEASELFFKHRPQPDSSSQIQAMDSARALVASVGSPVSGCFAYCQRYSSWETDKIIQGELYRNLGLAAACVFVVTFILIAHIGTSVLVFSCVVFTVINCAGSMYLWGLTIDTVTSVILILAIGLAVDYSAHIGHHFMTVAGSRDERTLTTLREMGLPVFNGGFSTVLAFILLAGSNSYVFFTFFKVFLLVVLYGLFHGMVYLPTLLSWIGPSSYMSVGVKSVSSLPSAVNVQLATQKENPREMPS